jgi:hypothetical protein
MIAFETFNPTTGKDELIPDGLWRPQHNDQRFAEPGSDGLRTIFKDSLVTFDPMQAWIETGEGLTYSRSDLLVAVDGASFAKLNKAAQLAAEEVGNRRSARFVEHMLRVALDSPELWLGHIKAGVEASSGFSYNLYGYKETGPGSDTPKTS